MALQSTKEIIQGLYRFKPFTYTADVQLIEKQNEAFENGKKGIAYPPKEKIKWEWIKTWVTEKGWNNYYSQIGSYCPLEFGQGGVWVGFCVPWLENQELLSTQSILSDEEAIQVDLFRRNSNTAPYPLREK